MSDNVWSLLIVVGFVCAALDALDIAALRPPPDLAQQLSKESGE